MEDGYQPAEGTMVVRMPAYSFAFNTLAEGITVSSMSGNNYVATLPTPPARQGYSFLGWNLSINPANTMGVRTGAITFSQDITLTFYAKWQVDLSSA